MESIAIKVQNLNLCKGKSCRILNNLEMSVDQGTIYGLTGSSGSGKTSLISCLLKIQPFDSGRVFLFGHDIRERNTEKLLNIPGSAVGYMPQHTALYPGFTIQETLQYFGKLGGMEIHEIKESTKELVKLLHLPKTSTKLQRLSGGEQRRVSLAVAMMSPHTRKLLVLDEPTAGMDPLLRVCIWDYLKFVVDKWKITALISTHYIDELKLANKIGVMRDGHLIMENSPAALLERCNASSLDEAVLQVCKNNFRFISLETASVQPTNSSASASLATSGKSASNVKLLRNKVGRVFTIVNKNWITMLRNWIMFLSLVGTPAFQMVVVMLVGYEPADIPLGVVNQELIDANLTLESNQLCPKYISETLDFCSMELLSCRFLEQVSRERISLIKFPSEQLAREAVENGHTVGWLHFPRYFSDNLIERYMISGLGSNDSQWEEATKNSGIIARLDETNKVIRVTLMEELAAAQAKFIQNLLSVCGEKDILGRYSLQYKTPIFGNGSDYKISDYWAPGVTLVFMFNIAVALIGNQIVWEKESKTLERLRVSGVPFSEIICAYVISEAGVVTLQAVILFLVYISWFPMLTFTLEHALLALFLIALAGYMGISIGILLGLLCTNQTELGILVMGLLMPNYVLSGAVFPIEAMPVLMQGIVQYLPITKSIESLRGVWYKGFTATHPTVYYGVLVNILYTIASSCVSILFAMRQQ